MEIEKIKDEINGCIASGCINDIVLRHLTDAGGNPIAKESDLWDYKREQDNSKSGMAKTVRSIVSLYNSYGGYLIYGVEEEVKDSKFSFRGVNGSNFDVAKLKSTIASYIGDRIDVTHSFIDWAGVNLLRRISLMSLII